MKPLIERITQGPVKNMGGKFITRNNWTVIAEIPEEGRDFSAPPRDEREANATLIAEAFNVAHETGKTPAELADELTELVNLTLEWWKDHEFDTDCGGTRNVYSDTPRFVERAKQCSP